MKLFLSLFFFSFSLVAGTITGKVVGVSDGDTNTVLDSAKKQYKIRFDHIDTLESKQAFGQNAKQHLSKLVFGKQVKVTTKTKDRYGRYIGTAYLNTTNIILKWYKLAMLGIIRPTRKINVLL